MSMIDFLMRRPVELTLPSGVSGAGVADVPGRRCGYRRRTGHLPAAGHDRAAVGLQLKRASCNGRRQTSIC